ncbi:S9 family peptidase [Dyadobacter psychrotolerans]|uniref:S9 family peptidase n=1 Tax=Dyadobacter psychrotolerans TaxID=2541721 RepID=A0A4R5DW25_9BACT|nr:S9 family peptidase [Dyadobacter psychrotolerans]TDE18679.1 S9 family peptidase [Dyadobacter psychrotolerans]
MSRNFWKSESAGTFCHVSNYHLLLTFFLLFCSLTSTFAQGKKADYQRAEKVKQVMDTKVFYAPSAFHWLEDNAKVWYANSTPTGKKFVLADVKNKTKQPAFDHQKLASGLAIASGMKVNPDSLPFTDIAFVDNGKALEFTVNETAWKCSLDSYVCTKTVKRPDVRRRGFWGDNGEDNTRQNIVSPDGKWTAFVKSYNVYVEATDKSVKEFAMSFDGSEGDYYSPVLSWSPDSKKLVAYKIRPNKPHLIYFIESTPNDQFQPKLHSRNYLKPGDALPQKQPHLFLIDSKKHIEVETGMGHQYAVTNPKWWKDSRGFTFEYNQRGHQAYRVISVDADGKAVDLISETSKTFIDYSGKKYRQDINDGKEIIWASERDGWNHLYLYDGLTGKVKNQITKGEWVVRKVVKVDEAKQTIIFEGSGREKGQDPYLIQYYKVHFDGSGLTALTSENGTHAATFSSDYQYFVDTYSRVDLPPVTTVKSAVDGKILQELEKADITELQKMGWKAPEVFVAKARDDKTDIYGIIVRPINYNPKKSYPVIELIYAGPHSSHAPKVFNSDFRYRFLHELAELGFVVVQLDGMGTSNRSKAFHDVCWQNIKDAGFPDRIKWIKAAAAKYPYMDATRVGVFGNSAGGQNSAAALLLHPDFYKVAVSSSGCHDNRMDKIWWNEQWMGYPIGPQYTESSNSTHAAKLKGKLLLILGEMDDNVDPASTMQFMDALIKANKPFDFLMVPGMGHSLGGDYGEHKRRDFFVKHLLGVEPPAWEGMD